MRIKSITISGLRSFGPTPVTLDLKPRTVLIGPHGAGKSTVLMALEMLNIFANGRSHEMPFLYDDEWARDVQNPDIKVHALMEGDTVSDESKSECEIVIAHQMQQRRQGYLESEKITKTEGQRKLSYEFHGVSGIARKEMAYEVRDEMRCMLDIHKFNRAGQTYFAAAVHGGDKMLTEQITHEFKAMYGDFRGFEIVNTLAHLPTVGLREKSGRLVLTKNLSSGMRTYLGLLAFLMGPLWRKNPGILLLEEPDAGLHPDMLHRLADVIKRASEYCQIVMTTNNPGMVSEFSETPEDVVVVERPFDYTELNRVEQEPLEHWLKDYSLGHAWESGAIGGRMDVS